MAAHSPHADRLRRAGTTLDASEDQVDAARSAIRRQEAISDRTHAELDRLTGDIAAQTASALLNDTTMSVSDTDGAILAGLRQAVDVGAGTLAELRLVLAHRERSRDAAKREKHAAARAFLNDNEQAAAQENVAAGWELIRRGLVRSQAAFFASEVKYIDPQRTSLPTPITGPAGEFVTFLALARLPKGHPFDLSPAWLNDVQAGLPGKMDGVESEVARLLDLVERSSK